jgi:putative tryptophan/tyrosine transport system substrate-binding protein
MKRRQFLKLIGSAAFVGPVGAHAQVSKTPVIGFLNPASAKGLAPQLAAFKQGLKDAGYVDGSNVRVEYRWADGQYDRLPNLAADLANRKVALIAATGGSFSVRAAKQATEQAPIPILFVSGLDPVNEHVASLDRPGRKVTGVAVQTTAEVLLKKRVELLRLLVPGAATIALLTNKNNGGAQVAGAPPNAAAAAAREVESAITGRRAMEENPHFAVCSTFCPISARTDAELDTVVKSLGQKDRPALIVGADPFFTDRRAQIVAIAKKYGVPAIYPWREYVDAGGLMSYGSSLTGAYLQVGRYSGRILSGADPTELPVVQEIKFELALNLRTAKAFNLKVPPALNSSADYVVK